MSHSAYVLFAATLMTGAALARCQRSTTAVSTTAAPVAVAAGDTSAARGAQLVLLGGCDDCHTPQLPNGEPDMSRRFSGVPAGSAAPPSIANVVATENLAFSGPWGTSFPRNITPDVQHGIGSWNVQDFIRTMRTGTDPQGHALLPPMPYKEFGKLPDADLTAIYNFIRTVAPSSNAVTGP